MVKIKFLGTVGVFGVPIWNCNCKTCKSINPKNKRLRSSIFIQIQNKNILIDFCPDIRTQILNYKIKRLDYAFLTHAHGDHMNGYSDLSKQDNLIIESHEKVLKRLYKRMGNGKEWLKRRNPTVSIKSFKKKKIGNFIIDSVALIHKKDYLKKSEPCYGYVFKSKKFSFAYLNDFNDIIEKEKLKNLDLLISDGCGFENTGIGHLGVKNNIDLFKELKPKKMLLTHINHTTEHEFLNKYLKKYGNIKIAFDGMQVKID
jgi:phosphoribosyl 1,2-cyclic phosphate phosphodiesterase